MPQYDYQIGTTYGGMVNVESLPTPVFAPKRDPMKYTKPMPLGDTNVRALGWLTTGWHWDFMTQAQYTQIKTFCPGLSAQVYIKTKDNSGAYKIYTATMLWPTQEPERDRGRVMDITITFIALVEYIP